ncbi:MAG TPA: AraC family transcriptional regulator [Thermoanaerobaculia bacterium]|nr:AraC family transcriptional regulator [Thermoanaerobaculia bacterium]
MRRSNPPADQPLDTVLFRSRLLQIGAFRAEPSHPRFHDSGPTENDIFVFPRTSVWLRHEGGKPFVSSPNLVTYYNKGQVYARDKVSEVGDRCEWFALDRTVLLEVLRSREPTVAEHPDRPFPFSHGPSDSQSYLAQRLIVRHLMTGKPIDPLYVEEAMLHVLARLLGHATEMHGARHRRAEAPSGDVLEGVKALLAREFREPLSLQEIADRAGFSVFHLCRLFRRGTGTTLHAWRSQLRLRTSLELVADQRTDLTGIGLDLGYSSHSHFTAAFRQTFKVTPSALRQTASESRLRELAQRFLPDLR